MYKTGDIVAVYGETATGTTIHENHPEVTGVDLTNPDSSIPPTALENVARFELCEIRRAPVRASHGYVLVVSPIKKAEKMLVVHERQCRLVEREGKKIEARPAKYIAWCQVNDDYQAIITKESLDSAKTWLKAMRDEERDNLDDNGYELEDYGVYKGIDISDEVTIE